MPRLGEDFTAPINGWTTQEDKSLLIAVAQWFRTSQSDIIRAGSHRECIRKLATLSPAEREDFERVHGNVMLSERLAAEIAAEKGAV